jgi:hypothetical protein
MAASHSPVLAAWLAIAAAAWVGIQMPTRAADELVVLAEPADATPPLAIPSVTAGFASLTDVSEAVEADRQRITLLERRLQELEAATQAEPLPTPGEAASATPAPKADFGFTAGRGLQIATALNGGTNEGTSVLNARGSGGGAMSLQTDGIERARIDENGNTTIGGGALATTFAAASHFVTFPSRFRSRPEFCR